MAAVVRARDAVVFANDGDVAARAVGADVVCAGIVVVTIFVGFATTRVTAMQAAEWVGPRISWGADVACAVVTIVTKFCSLATGTSKRSRSDGKAMNNRFAGRGVRTHVAAVVDAVVVIIAAFASVAQV